MSTRTFTRWRALARGAHPGRPPTGDAPGTSATGERGGGAPLRAKRLVMTAVFVISGAIFIAASSPRNRCSAPYTRGTPQADCSGVGFASRIPAEPHRTRRSSSPVSAAAAFLRPGSAAPGTRTRPRLHPGQRLRIGNSLHSSPDRAPERQRESRRHVHRQRGSGRGECSRAPPRSSRCGCRRRCRGAFRAPPRPSG